LYFVAEAGTHSVSPSLQYPSSLSGAPKPRRQTSEQMNGQDPRIPFGGFGPAIFPASSDLCQDFFLAFVTQL
jgi:hypothetical protein